MSTLMKPLLVREQLLNRKIKIFTPMQFGRIFKISDHTLKYFLEKRTEEGLFIRLKKGLYTLKTDLPAEEEIANAVYQPSHLSFEYALSYYSIIPEMTYSITSATTMPTRQLSIANKSYVYYSIKKSAYTGYSLVKTETKSFLIADKEKALTDYLYFYCLGKKPFNDRLVLKDIDKNKLLSYAKLYRRDKLKTVITKIYDQQR